MKCGSRFETLESLGASRVLMNLLARGGNDRVKFNQVMRETASRLEVTFERELVGLSVYCQPEAIEQIMRLLKETFFDLRLEDFQNQIQIEKELALRQTMGVSRDQHEFTMEGLIFSTFRDHMLGQPKHGNRDQIMDL